VYSTTENVFQIREFDQAIQYEKGRRIQVGNNKFGTPPYVAPEVTEYDERIDIFSAEKIIQHVIDWARITRPNIHQAGQMLLDLEQHISQKLMPIKIPHSFRQDSWAVLANSLVASTIDNNMN
jgi:hypothetical protein